MSLTIVILLLGIGIGLLMIEIFLVPGIGIAGIVGAVVMIVGLVFAYQIDNTTGHVSLVITGSLSTILTVFAFRANTWKIFSLDSSIDSKVHNVTEGLSVGDEGKTISRLSPMGSARFGEELVEVTSYGEFIDQNTPVRIARIEKDKIYIKPI